LLTWCNTYPNTQIKLFSDSHQEAVNKGWQHQQMSMQKEVYIQQVADAIFLHNHNQHIRQLYVQYPSLFVKPIKSHFQFCFNLHKKYNEANKTLSSTGAGLTIKELKDKPEMSMLVNKILVDFLWWADLHSSKAKQDSHASWCYTGLSTKQPNIAWVFSLTVGTHC
ncbi:hypothetical protein PISMIDRAFT_102718, partial [Pisolithus microcarpus 441]